MALHPEDAIALRSRRRYTQVPEPTEEYIKLTRLEGIVVSLLCAVLLVGSAVRTPIILFELSLADFFSPCYNEKKRRRYFYYGQACDPVAAEGRAVRCRKSRRQGRHQGRAGRSGRQGPGLVEVHVNINGLPSSNADLMLDTTF